VAGDRHAVRHARRVAREQEDLVLERPGPGQEAPVLDPRRRPRRGDEEHTGTLVHQRARELGEPQVVAGHQPHPAQLGVRNRRGVAGHEELGLARAREPEEMALPVRERDLPGAVDEDRGVVDPERAPLEEAAGEDEAVGGAGRVPQGGDQRPVERRRRLLVLVEREVAGRPELGEQDEVDAGARGRDLVEHARGAGRGGLGVG
jgi:hypothetical protein